MRNKILILVFTCLGLLSCSRNDDYNLMASIFIEDPDYPGLPQYSEWGYNTFGAYIDRVPFISTSDAMPGKIVVRNDTLQLILRGKYKNGEAVLVFKFKGYNPTQPSELVNLNNREINLKQTGCEIQFTSAGNTNSFVIIEGLLKFTRVQRLFVDELETKCIISGLFDFKTFINGEPIAVSHGRFDLGIGYDNFFNLSLPSSRIRQ